jgi:hypothetical protein
VKFSNEDLAALLHQAIDTKDLYYVNKKIVGVPWDGNFKDLFNEWSEEQDKTSKPK